MGRMGHRGRGSREKSICRPDQAIACGRHLGGVYFVRYLCYAKPFQGKATGPFVGSHRWLNVNTKQYRKQFQEPGVNLRNP